MPTRRMPVIRPLRREAAMLRNLKDLLGYTIGATDGSVGHVKDFYSDDKSWVIRYIVVQTRRLDVGSESADFADLDRQAGLGRENATGLYHQASGEEQP